MAFDLRQQLKLAQQLVMTPQLQMAIKLLQLNRLELLDTIRQELEENPTLEELQEVIEKDPETEKNEETSEIKEVDVEETARDDIDWENYLNEYNSTGKSHFENEKKETPSFENFIGNKESLHDHMLWQLRMIFPSKEVEHIGSLIIGNLKSDGYLDASIDDIASLSGSSPEKVNEVLTTLQSFNPAGVCARDLKESLAIQVKQLGLENSIVNEIILHHLTHLENKNYNAIAKALKISIDDVISAVDIIQGLEPRPGRLFSDDEPKYITPDIYIYKLENEFMIVLNDDGMPKLHINSYYKNTMKRNSKFLDKEREYIDTKMRSAAWLIRSIHQRQKTIFKVMESILGFQREFFEKGSAYLKPMVLRDVAQDIGMHESTISRVTTNKYVYTDQGIFELKYFFNSSINKVRGGSVASTSVREKIKEIIKTEYPEKPYSDDKIAVLLEKHNISIARRTVAKYREALKILPSNKRKQFRRL
ncbi:RNA polymerase sigma-54 factor [Desulfosarcina sp. BuS5]|uniref:RNA polymerase factor sigma-54 n=1 Tax=Desulfosarcina sp. BuS5 TaxID=933262 RepID=UPI0004860EDF|nr:RNA polymerase factor sigma-54 [Desulfosarcina sp. BuS5]WDN89677.1 RNA polymerase sigma-54 factor [Desulfosarcina sp. BuS5]